MRSLILGLPKPLKIGGRWGSFIAIMILALAGCGPAAGESPAAGPSSAGTISSAIPWETVAPLTNTQVTIPMPSPTSPATATPLPQPTNTPLPPSATPIPGLLSGKGQQASASFSLDEGLAIFHVKHGGTGYFHVWLLDAQGQIVDLLAGGIGPFDGTTAVGLKQAGKFLLDVRADGPWEVWNEQPRPASAPPPTAMKGKGHSTSPLFALKSGLATFRLTHDGDGIFAVWLLDAKGQRLQLLANTMGPFSGSKPVGIRASGIYLLNIETDDNWSISVEQ